MGRGEYGSNELVGEREVGWSEVDVGSEGGGGERRCYVKSAGQSVHGAEGVDRE